MLTTTNGGGGVSDRGAFPHAKFIQTTGQAFGNGAHS